MAPVDPLESLRQRSKRRRPPVRGGGAAHRRKRLNAGGCSGSNNSLTGQALFPTAARNTHLLSALSPLLRPRHDVRCHRNGGVDAQLPADAAEAGRTGVRLPGALSGRGSRDEPGVGDR